MRKAICFFAAVLVLCSSVFAASIPGAWIEDGNTILGVFKVQGTADAAYYQEIKLSGSNFIFHSVNGQRYYFGAFPAGSTVTFRQVGSYFEVRCTGLVNGLLFVSDGDGFVPENRFQIAPNVWYQFSVLVGGSYFVEHDVNTLDNRVVADYEGYLVLRDDLDGSGAGGWWDSLLDWLSSFWDNLLSFFLRIFVPSNGYFTSWFNDVRTAFDAKVGGLTDMFKALADGFGQLSSASSSSSFVITLPSGYLYRGFPGARVDVMQYILPYAQWLRPVFNAILFLFTAIVCYRHLIKMIKT